MNLKQAKEILGIKFAFTADFISEVIKTLELKKYAKILDVGTGAGFMAIHLAFQGYKVLTGEPEGDYWADWKSNAKKANVEHLITFKPFRAESMPFNDETFDVVFLYCSFHHIEKKSDALKECVRVIKRNGLIVIIEFTQNGINYLRKMIADHPDAVDPRDYDKNLPISIEVKESTTINAYIYRKK